MRATTRLPILFLLALVCLGAKQPLDLIGAQFEFTSALAKTKASAKKLGKVKGAEFQSVSVELLAGNTWTAQIAGSLALSGSYTRKNEFSGSLVCSLDSSSQAALASHYAQQIETSLAVEQGLSADINLSLVSSQIKLRIKPKAKQGTASAKLLAKFIFTGTTTGGGVSGAPSKVKARLKGNSLPIDLAQITE